MCTRLIINADDFGKTHTINLAIAECFKRGCISNTTIMVNMPYADEAVEIAKKEGFFDKVGLHVNLTEGRALSSRIVSPKLVNGGVLTGKFHESIKGRMLLPREEKRQFYTEIESQIRKYLDYGFTEFHMDSHCHVHTGLSVYPAYKALIKKYGFKSMRLTRNMAIDSAKLPIKLYKQLLNDNIRKTASYASDYFGSFLDFKEFRKLRDNEAGLGDAVIEIMCHPDLVWDAKDDKGCRLINLYAGDGAEKDLTGFFDEYMRDCKLVSYKDLW